MSTMRVLSCTAAPTLSALSAQDSGGKLFLVKLNVPLVEDWCRLPDLT